MAHFRHKYNQSEKQIICAANETFFQPSNLIVMPMNVYVYISLDTWHTIPRLCVVVEMASNKTIK